MLKFIGMHVLTSYCLLSVPTYYPVSTPSRLSPFLFIEDVLTFLPGYYFTNKPSSASGCQTTIIRETRIKPPLFKLTFDLTVGQSVKICGTDKDTMLQNVT